MEKDNDGFDSDEESEGNNISIVDLTNPDPAVSVYLNSSFETPFKRSFTHVRQSPLANEIA